MKATMMSILFCAACVVTSFAQPMERKVSIVNNKMTPEMLLTLNRVSGMGLTADKKEVVYAVSHVVLGENKKVTEYFKIPVTGGVKTAVKDPGKLLGDDKINSTGKYRILSKEVKVKSVLAQDFHKDVKQANVYIYDDLNYRHWDKWEDGKYGHVIIESMDNSQGMSPIDIMANEPFDCPQQPFGGSEDYIWHPDGDKVLYVTKKLSGKDYAVSTNTDIYQYSMKDKKTINLTDGNEGYDNSPSFSPKGTLAWLQMKRDGYESDKNDIIVRLDGEDVNLTGKWDGTVNSFIWSDDGSIIYFNAPVNGTVQLFEVPVGKSDSRSVKQITSGQFDVNGLIGQAGNNIVVHRRDMNHATEIYLVSLNGGAMKEITTENKKLYQSINMSRVEKRMVPTTDGKEMLTWVIFPPNFDPAKKYPTLLYCQGGPQGALSQFYSYRWNFQLMAAQGYIVVAPNRRGMPGYGVEWNEQISGDYGGQNMQDYLSAIDLVV